MTVLASRHRSCMLVLLLVEVLSFLSIRVAAEIRTFNGRIDAASSYIHFSEGFLIAPGYVDLSDLVFTTTDDENRNRAMGHEEDTPEDDEKSTRDPGSDEEDGHDGANAHNDPAGSTIDIALFHEPSSCSNSRSGCDWTELGIGATDSAGGLRWCCSDEAADLGFCDGGGNQYGRLIVNVSSFTGLHRFIPVPPTGKMETRIKYGKLEEPMESGKYVLVLANCNDNGRDVMVKGKYTWKSSKGYLPGDLFGAMYFFAILTGLYLILFGWYGINMKKHEDSIIPIQKWILATIGMGLLETFFKTGDFFVWNEDGTRFWFAMYTGVFIGVLKRGMSRCLILVVSMGWGVVRNDIGDQMRNVVILGLVYISVSAARDIMTLFAVTENQTLSIDEEEELFDVVTILTFVVAAVDVTYYMWILDALNGTMQYLENNNQNVKLKRYLHLRCILLFNILFAVVWSVLGIVDNYLEETMFEEEKEWAIQALWELNYLVVLVAVSVLWRPNPSAKDYAFVMELPAISGDGEGDFEANIPSANDDDVEEEQNAFEQNNGGFKDDVGVSSNNEENIKVSEAVHA